MTEKVNRVEVIDHTKSLADGGGRAYTYWHMYRDEDLKYVSVSLDIQDDGKTLKIFIQPK